MNIEFDPAKDTANIAKHGMSLTLAAKIECSDVLCAPDIRRDHGEVREISFTLIDRAAVVRGGVCAAQCGDANRQPAQSQFT